MAEFGAAGLLGLSSLPAVFVESRIWPFRDGSFKDFCAFAAELVPAFAQWLVPVGSAGLARATSIAHPAVTRRDFNDSAIILLDGLGSVMLPKNSMWVAQPIVTALLAN